MVHVVHVYLQVYNRELLSWNPVWHSTEATGADFMSIDTWYEDIWNNTGKSVLSDIHTYMHSI